MKWRLKYKGRQLWMLWQYVRSRDFLGFVPQLAMTLPDRWYYEYYGMQEGIMWVCGPVEVHYWYHVADAEWARIGIGRFGLSRSRDEYDKYEEVQ